mmetsp:Transcript_10898/g.40788  ORF Transcript_10898/g.40788 Transcript_10898/m.40788 type:complete len:204 (+) Transcript_10898:23-634(+)
MTSSSLNGAWEAPSEDVKKRRSPAPSVTSVCEEMGVQHRHECKAPQNPWTGQPRLLQRVSIEASFRSPSRGFSANLLSSSGARSRLGGPSGFPACCSKSTPFRQPAPSPSRPSHRPGWSSVPRKRLEGLRLRPSPECSSPRCSPGTRRGARHKRSSCRLARVPKHRQQSGAAPVLQRKRGGRWPSTDGFPFPYQPHADESQAP